MMHPSTFILALIVFGMLCVALGYLASMVRAQAERERLRVSDAVHQVHLHHVAQYNQQLQNALNKMATQFQAYREAMNSDDSSLPPDPGDWWKVGGTPPPPSDLGGASGRN